MKLILSSRCEDYHTLRQILENLVQLSKDQEELIGEFKKNKQYNARYVELRQLQRRITDESKIVEDSLLALSKRNPVIAHFINDEISSINWHLDQALSDLASEEQVTRWLTSSM